MKQPVYLRAGGLFTEHCASLADLQAWFLQDKTPITDGELHQPANIRLKRSELAVIAREDRSILNDLATSLLNATADLQAQAGFAGALPDAEQTPLYAGTDGVAEYSFTALAMLIERCGSAGATMQQWGQLSGMTNPINMMRFLSTNPVYHLSKRLQLRGGGYPLRGMSLSGLHALEDAHADVAAGRQQAGLVAASASMRSFDSLVIFGKLGLLEPGNPQANLHPSYGTALLWLTQQAAHAQAEVVAVHCRYNSEPFPSRQDWLELLHYAKQQAAIDCVVSYCNGVKANDENERSAIAEVFGEVAVRNYKAIFGYTSKANNALDLLAVLADPSVPVGSTILINGAGFGVGIGFAVIRKLAHTQAVQQGAGA